MNFEINLVLLMIGAVLMGSITMALIIPMIVEPGMDIQGKQQAFILAKTLESEINGLNYAGSGSIEKFLEVDWDIDIQCKSPKNCEVVVSHEKVKSTDIGIVNFYGPINVFSEEKVKRLKMEKEEGKEITITKIGETS